MTKHSNTIVGEILKGFLLRCTGMQFNKNFTFKDAMQVIPYLNELGISHCYAISNIACPPDSTHGYDIIIIRAKPEIGRPAKTSMTL